MRRLAWLVLALLLAGSGAWWGVLSQAPLHEDEAIYAAWALRGLRADPWLWTTPVDKPPLTFYPLMLSLACFGRHDWAVRLPNLAWTLLALGLVARIAARRGRPPWVAVGLALCSPLLWAQAAAAFTDPPMLALALLALDRALAARPTASGLALGLACLAKPTALFLLPLVLVALSVDSWARLAPPWHDSVTVGERKGWSAPPGWRDGVLAFAAPLLAAWAWDASRAAPSWWALGAQAYGTLGDPAAQGRAWSGAAWASLGWLALIVAMGAWLGHQAREPRPSLDRWTGALALTLALWLPAHALLGFQPWPRYLLPLVPLLALLGAEWMPLRALGLSAPRRRPAPVATVRLSLPGSPPRAQTGRRTGGLRYPPPRLLALGAVALAFVLLVPALVPAYGLAPHDGRWEGIRTLGATIEALPAGAQVFYRDLGRPLAWYAADTPATLTWGGPAWERLDPDPARPTYLAVRASEPLPPGSWRVVASRGAFRLLRLK